MQVWLNIFQFMLNFDSNINLYFLLLLLLFPRTSPEKYLTSREFGPLPLRRDVSEGASWQRVHGHIIHSCPPLPLSFYCRGVLLLLGFTEREAKEMPIFITLPCSCPYCCWWRGERGEGERDKIKTLKSSKYHHINVLQEQCLLLHHIRHAQWNHHHIIISLFLNQNITFFVST